jgi:hypothetical protein
MKDTEQPTERGKSMRTTRLIAVLVGLAAIAMVAADASAYYHPGMGTFMSRDPGAGNANRIGAGGPAVGGGFIPRDPTGSNQYADGMNLYQYVRSQPTRYLDPSGLRTWLPGPPAHKVTWKKNKEWFFRSLTDDKCRFFRNWNGEAVLGQVKTRYGHKPGGNILLTIYDTVNDIPLNIPVVSKVQTVVNSVENLTSISRARTLWDLVAIYYAINIYASDCPKSCECDSSYCLRNYPYKHERTSYAIDRTEYQLAQELVLPGEQESIEDLQGKSEEAIREILKKMINKP